MILTMTHALRLCSSRICRVLVDPHLVHSGVMPGASVQLYWLKEAWNKCCLQVYIFPTHHRSPLVERFWGSSCIYAHSQQCQDPLCDICIPGSNWKFREKLKILKTIGGCSRTVRRSQLDITLCVRTLLAPQGVKVVNWQSTGVKYDVYIHMYAYHLYSMTGEQTHSMLSSLLHKLL